MLDSSQQSIVTLIHRGGPLSRTALARALGISKTAISHPVRQLLELGFLEEEAASATGQGRPSVLLALQSGHSFFIGVSLLNEQLELLLLDLNGEVHAHRQCEIERQPERLVALITEQIPLLIEQGEISRESVLGIGIALSGVVTESRDRCLKSTILDWVDVPLADMLERSLVQTHALSIPVCMENDAKSLAIAQHLFAHARDVKDFTLITLGEGIGSAHFINGQLYRGAHGGAGEIAHTTVEPNNLPCRCGKRGCLDTVASLIAIREQAQQEQLSAVTIPELEALAATGHSPAVRILHRAGNALGLAMANIIQINDPERVLLAHPEHYFEGLFATIVKQSMMANVLPNIADKIEIKPFVITPQSWPYAAASVAIYQFLYQ
ncbi:ROK family protein [Vibrio sp. CAIM 722]|uniref:ROK family protein n=1 Tax=Vibrio eleionomae TaxID=2653505 RepID=A0A7X4RTQ1_9VIBR|nr:ROK family protein [Vibrio eleionomae]MZI93051.1 ROK family protein [Vibrio eleionomae]